ncbi:MAG: hypothetical protein ACREHD_26510 [Pirellulales bacterium]
MNPPTLQSSARNLLVSGGLAALLSFLVLEAAYPFFVPPASARPIVFGPVPPSDEELAAGRRVKFQNEMALMALSGGFLAAALAISEGRERRSLQYLLVGVSGGVAFGSVFGAAAGFSGQWLLDFQLSHNVREPWRTIAAQAATWGILGAGAGFGLTLPLLRFGAISRGLAGGAAGGALAGIVYCLLGFLAFLSWRWVGLDLVPTDILNQVIWLFAPALCITATVAAFRTASRAPKAEATDAAVA